MSDSPLPTVTVRETVTATVSATNTAGAGPAIPTVHSHPFPQAFPGLAYGQYPPPFIPMAGLAPSVQPGSLVSPFAAVLCILTVAGCYWAFKYLPHLNASDGASSGSNNSEKDEKDKEKDKTLGASSSNSTGAQMLTISPAAFISLFCFALLAVVIVQGPLGLAQAFTGQDMNVQAESTNARNTGQRPGVGQVQALLDIMQLHPLSKPSASTGGEQPRIGGQHQVVGPNGAASSSWFIHQGAPPGAAVDGNRAAEKFDLTVADRLALAGLPPPFQSLDPAILAEILQFDGSETGARPKFDSARANAPVAKPVPLIPQNGFFGSYQGLKSLENAFYPMLVGAIGLIVLFDYGT